MIKVLDYIKMKNEFTEEEYINLLNKAPVGFVEEEVLKNEVLTLFIESSKAEELFNELFDGMSYGEYRELFKQDEKYGEDVCDIVIMIYLINNIGDNVSYHISRKEFYKHEQEAN